MIILATNGEYEEDYQNDLEILTGEIIVFDTVLSIIENTNNFKTICWIMNFVGWLKKHNLRDEKNKQYKNFKDFIENILIYQKNSGDPENASNFDVIKQDLYEAILYNFHENEFIPQKLLNRLERLFPQEAFSTEKWKNNGFNRSCDDNEDDDF